jgi:hypothetical protein
VGALTPAAAPNTYTAAANHLAGYVTVDAALPAGSGASVSTAIGGVSASNLAALPAIQIRNAAALTGAATTAYPITVLAENGVTQTVYTVSVVRSNGAEIGLTLSPGGIITFSGAPTSPIYNSSLLNFALSPAGTTGNWFVQLSGPGGTKTLSAANASGISTSVTGMTPTGNMLAGAYTLNVILTLSDASVYSGSFTLTLLY